MKTPILDPVSTAANALGALLGPHTQWCFLAVDEASGELLVYSNRRPEEIRSIVKKYLKHENGEERKREPEIENETLPFDVPEGD